MIDENHFWFYLLNVSESLDGLKGDAAQTREQLMAYLDTIDEVFGGADPVDDFEKYAVLALCKSVRRLMTAGNGKAR